MTGNTVISTDRSWSHRFFKRCVPNCSITLTPFELFSHAVELVEVSPGGTIRVAGLSDRFRSRIAIELFGGGIPVIDNSIGALDGIHGICAPMTEGLPPARHESFYCQALLPWFPADSRVALPKKVSVQFRTFERYKGRYCYVFHGHNLLITTNCL